jgi:hypothetical protein
MTTELLDTAAPTSNAVSQDATPPAGTTPAAEQGAQATASADNPPAADAKAEGNPPADDKPTDYEPFQLPEGVTADEELLGEFKATAKKLGLSQEGAQELASLQAKAFAKQQEAMATTRSQWAEQSKTDKEFGGEALQENLGVAKKALEAFASPDLRKLLNESGLGNHPEVIRHFVRVGKAISEDGRIVSGSKAGAPSDPAKRLFPNQA